MYKTIVTKLNTNQQHLFTTINNDSRPETHCFHSTTRYATMPYSMHSGDARDEGRLHLQLHIVIENSTVLSLSLSLTFKPSICPTIYDTTICFLEICIEQSSKFEKTNTNNVWEKLLLKKSFSSILNCKTSLRDVSYLMLVTKVD